MIPIQLHAVVCGVMVLLLLPGVSVAQNLEGGITQPAQLSIADVSRVVEPAESAHALLPSTGSVPPASSTLPLPLNGSMLYRDLPSISGEYTVNGTTLMPYLGAGFGSGYPSDLDRALNNQGTPVQPDAITGNLLGPNMAPNEVRMGIRIPF